YAHDGLLFWGYGLFALLVLATFHTLERRGVRIRSLNVSSSKSSSFLNHVMARARLADLSFKIIKYLAPALLIALAICQGLVARDVALIAMGLLAGSAA
ncbi:MAG: hypothetical protein GTO13_07530, partial [Proteobacteria bacterium]|nr:hypothetical protein [Pseudomonadota bacterium]